MYGYRLDNDTRSCRDDREETTVAIFSCAGSAKATLLIGMTRRFIYIHKYRGRG